MRCGCGCQKDRGVIGCGEQAGRWGSTQIFETSPTDTSNYNAGHRRRKIHRDAAGMRHFHCCPPDWISGSTSSLAAGSDWSLGSRMLVSCPSLLALQCLLSSHQHSLHPTVQLRAPFATSRFHDHFVLESRTFSESSCVRCSDPRTKHTTGVD
jgi:hypothetical protein